MNECIRKTLQKRLDRLKEWNKDEIGNARSHRRWLKEINEKRAAYRAEIAEIKEVLDADTTD
jgi:hypothetical protein